MGITLEEFASRLAEVQNEYPDEAISALQRSANRMRKALITNTPDSGKKHRLDILPMPKGRGFLDTNGICLLK